MNFAILPLNHWAGPVLALAWPMLWQSSLLIGVLFGLDFALRRRLRASVRYALWLVVLLKLMLPPALALPTGLGWWLRPASAAAARPRPATVVVTYSPAPALWSRAPASFSAPARPAARLSAAAWALAASGVVSLGLLAWMLVRWRQVVREARRADPAPDWLEELFAQARCRSGVRRRVRLRLLDRPMSPAVSGLFRPVILVPRALAEQLPPDQLQTVLLHELVHLRRGDLWLSFIQTLVQVVYWWHPLLWLANARIRRAREEAVDDAVMLALEGDAGVYAPTLLEVARLALARPPLSLGLVGILESRTFLRQRIERLLDFRPPRKAGLTLASLFSVAAFAALALPMGQAPAPAPKPEPAVADPSSPRQVPPKVIVHVESPEPGATDPASALLSLPPLSDTASNADGQRSARLVQDGKLLYEMGQLDLAETKLQEASRLDPWNNGARYYLNLVREARRQNELTALSLLPEATRVTWPGYGRRMIESRLHRVRLDEVGPWEPRRLSEVLTMLHDQTLRKDDGKQGIGFFLNRDEVMAVQTDPYTGLPKPTLDHVAVTLDRPLKNARLADVLDAIVRGADQPIQYSIQDEGVVFSFRREEPHYFRTFKVDPNTFEQGSRKLLGSPTNDNSRLTCGQGSRLFFDRLGVDMSHGSSVFYKPRQGTLLVYASLADLDKIEKAIQSMNMPSRQLDIRVAFVELPEAETDTFWQKFGFADEPFPGGSARITTLSDSEAQEQLRLWGSADGTRILGQARVTTLDSRQAQVSVVQVQTILVSDAKGQSKPQEVPLGPSLEIFPRVSVTTNGPGVRMFLNAGVLEFLGYDDPGPFAVLRPGDTNAAAIVRPVPVPHFRFRHATALETEAADGQTLVLGGFDTRRIHKSDELELVLKGLPNANRLSQLQPDAPNGKEIIVLVTPVIVDPAGNRIYPRNDAR